MGSATARSAFGACASQNALAAPRRSLPLIAGSEATAEERSRALAAASTPRRSVAKVALVPAFPRTRLRNGGRTKLGYTDRVMAIGSLLAARGGLKKMRSCAVSTTGSGTRGTPRLGDNGA